MNRKELVAAVADAAELEQKTVDAVLRSLQSTLESAAAKGDKVSVPGFFSLSVGKREARQEIAMIKVQAANMVMSVLDRAIQLHGAMGMSDDTPIARFWRENRSMRIVDGPDEVHRMTIARRECRKWRQ